MDWVTLKCWSLGQSLEKSCLHSRSHIFGPIFLKHGQNVCLHNARFHLLIACLLHNARFHLLMAGLPHNAGFHLLMACLLHNARFHLLMAGLPHNARLHLLIQYNLVYPASLGTDWKWRVNQVAGLIRVEIFIYQFSYSSPDLFDLSISL